ncbi:uncharacterized protein LOC109720357 [Ananas comosus]|uniref:Uncharacterized protein LOC109720357 n=1 Tax=Ananas comosus TaxID=4615 RepID=A0A6P5GCE2_ANACO|nr:uncharacterized protein LOC109720357 [Ananas comosus]
MGWKAAEKIIKHWKILRGDNVMIIRGKDKGETGIIKRVIRSQNRVIVEGKNLVKKHIKQGQGHEGGIFSIEAPLHVSNVQVLDPVTGYDSFNAKSHFVPPEISCFAHNPENNVGMQMGSD